MCIMLYINVHKEDGVRTVTFTEFRNNASGILSLVERGEVFVIIRYGKPIAEVTPIASAERVPAWKQPALRLAVEGAGLSRAILRERADEDFL